MTKACKITEQRWLVECVSVFAHILVARLYAGGSKINLKQNEAQSARVESTHKGVNQRSKYVTQVQQQRPEPPTATLTCV